MKVLFILLFFCAHISAMDGQPDETKEPSRRAPSFSFFRVIGEHFEKFLKPLESIVTGQPHDAKRKTDPLFDYLVSINLKDIELEAASTSTPTEAEDEWTVVDGHASRLEPVLEKVKDIIKKKGVSAFQDENGTNIFHIIANKGMIEVLQILVSEENPSVKKAVKKLISQPDHDGIYPLAHALLANTACYYLDAEPCDTELSFLFFPKKRKKSSVFINLESPYASGESLTQKRLSRYFACAQILFNKMYVEDFSRGNPYQYVPAFYFYMKELSGPKKLKMHEPAHMLKEICPYLPKDTKHWTLARLLSYRVLFQKDPKNKELMEGLDGFISSILSLDDIEADYMLPIPTGNQDIRILTPLTPLNLYLSSLLESYDDNPFYPNFKKEINITESRIKSQNLSLFFSLLEKAEKVTAFTIFQNQTCISLNLQRGLISFIQFSLMALLEKDSSSIHSPILEEGLLREEHEKAFEGLLIAMNKNGQGILASANATMYKKDDSEDSSFILRNNRTPLYQAFLFFKLAAYNGEKDNLLNERATKVFKLLLNSGADLSRPISPFNQKTYLDVFTTTQQEFEKDAKKIEQEESSTKESDSSSTEERRTRQKKKQKLQEASDFLKSILGQQAQESSS